MNGNHRKMVTIRDGRIGISNSLINGQPQNISSGSRKCFDKKKPKNTLVETLCNGFSEKSILSGSRHFRASVIYNKQYPSAKLINSYKMVTILIIHGSGWR